MNTTRTILASGTAERTAPDPYDPVTTHGPAGTMVDLHLVSPETAIVTGGCETAGWRYVTSSAVHSDFAGEVGPAALVQGF